MGKGRKGGRRRRKGRREETDVEVA